METPFADSPWTVWAVFTPMIGAVAAFLWPRRAALVGCLATLATVGSVFWLIWQVAQLGPQYHAMGGWGAPLGIDLHADGLSAAMLLTTALVGAGVTLYATAYFQQATETARFFWALWLLLWSAMNALFLSGDLFNLYVTLELVGVASVALVALAGNSDALTGAMRYFLLSLLGSLTYLLGVALLYGAHGTLDIRLLSDLVTPAPADWAATGLIVAGLSIKTALVPLHFWLPPAHAAAPAPVSALLSALVVKTSFYLLLRLWLELFPVTAPGFGQVLGLLGALAIFWGSFQALRQARLKLLVAYSTVAQIGYLFLAFPLALTTAAATAWAGTVLFILSHALAKAAMFLAAGNILKFAGHDRIADLGSGSPGVALSWAAFGIAGISIIGLPPSAGFAAKWLLLQASFASGQWWWLIPIVGGSLLAAAYMFKVAGLAFLPNDQGDLSDLGDPKAAGARLSRRMKWTALGFALGALAMGFATPQILALLDSGTPFAQLGAVGVL